MNPVTIVMMVLVLGVVWGGFAVLLLLTSRRERQRRREGPGAGAPEGGSLEGDTPGGVDV